jgi:excinuclease ABC subunit C
MDLSQIPNSSGVYIFKNLHGTPIYIGKAVNLRSRVRSYWQETTWKDRPKLAVLVPQIEDIETIITKNEKEALILEATLVYKHQPKYNVLLKDNRTFPWIGITYGEPYPRLIPVRDIKWIKRKYPGAKLFGPYTDIGMMYKTLSTARVLFPTRKRATPLFKNRPCLNYHLGQCLGPCQDLISEEEYDLMLRQVELFLNGKYENLVEQLTEKMNQASENMNYETAAKYRDRIKLLQKSLENQNVVSDDPDCERDLIGFAMNENTLCLQIFKMRAGKLVGRESYSVELNEFQSIEEILESVIEQAYLVRQKEDIPKEIFVQDYVKAGVYFEELENEGNSSLNSIRQGIEKISEQKITIHCPKRGEKFEQVSLATQNAQQQLEQLQKSKAKVLLTLELLQEVLELPVTPFRIDCFDISHLQGTEVVACCVRFKDGVPDKSKYRKFKIKVDQNNDFLAMKEVVQRRYKGIKVDSPEIPELIIIDGGKGQLSSALEAVRELELEDSVNLFSLAKKDEEIFAVDGKKIVLPKNSPALQLLQRLRDEAHRFAITFNRERRSKSMKQSFIDELEGIGTSTKERLKKHFTLKELMNTSPQEIASKIGINAKRADRIWQILHQSSKEKENSHNTNNED